MQLNCSVCCLNFSPEDVVTQSTKKYIDSESLKLESFSGVLFSTPKSKETKSKHKSVQKSIKMRIYPMFSYFAVDYVIVIKCSKY